MNWATVTVELLALARTPQEKREERENICLLLSNFNRWAKPHEKEETSLVPFLPFLLFDRCD